MIQNIIVCKYGGSSVTSEADIKRIAKITSDDERRKTIVVSAPGKSSKNDVKLTDMLISLAKNPTDSDLSDRIMEKLYVLGSKDVKIKRLLEERLGRKAEGKEYEDAVKAFGEEACARISAEVLNLEYVDPSELFVFSEDFGNARILPKSKKMIRERLGKLEKAVVVPGFFGYTRDGRLATLSRGGNDLTGAYIAAALNAIVYENFTDSAILSASPEMVDKPRKIEEMTYKEARDLSFSGFNILHHQAMLPAEEAGVPIHVRSTKAYPESGTIIKEAREVDPSKPIVGVAYRPGFYYLSIEKSGLDDMLGVLHKLSGVLARESIQLLDAPGAIDDLTFIFHGSYIRNEGQLNRMKNRIYNVVGRRNTKLVLQDNLGMLAVSGIGMVGRKGILGDITDTISEAGVNILSVSQGIKERCILYGVDDSQGKIAVRAIYDKFLK